VGFTLNHYKTKKITLNKLDPLGNTVETIKLAGVWEIIVGGKAYIMTNRYVDEIKIDFEKMQKHFLDNGMNN